MKRVAIYTRVSTQEQAKEGYSIAAQRDKLLAFSKAKDWIVNDIYVDDGYTGTNLERPALKRLLNALENTDVILVYKLDRLSRSQRDVLFLVEEKFLENAVDFVSILEAFDTTTPFGRAMLGILAVFAQLERDTIIERSKLGKERRAKEGKWRGGPVPLGYDYAKGGLKINEYEASIIRQIFEKYIDGLGMDSIAKKLNSKGYRSKQNGKFTASKIKVYLNNPIYAGLIPYKDKTFIGSHKSLIDIDTFNLTTALLEKRSSSFRKTSNALLGGLLICGECGAKMFMRKIKNYSYYTCYTYHGGPSHMLTAKSCSLGYINSSKLENQVVSHLNYLNSDAVVIDSLIDQTLNSINTDSNEDTLDNLRKELSYTNKELTRWYDAYGSGHLDLNEVNSRIEVALKKKKNIEDLLSSMLQSKDESPVNHIDSTKLKQAIENFSLIWKSATNKERKIILKGFIKSIIVYRDKPPIIKFNL